MSKPVVGEHVIKESIVKNVFVKLVVISGLTFSCAGAQDASLSPVQARIAVQSICPVSGLNLGDHGAPVKAKIGEVEVFLCCEGCMKGQVNTTHWQTIHTNFAKAQGKCLVMDHKLPQRPEWSIIDGRVIFVCCPPCIEKLQAEPEKFVRKLDTVYQSSAESKNPVPSTPGE